MVKDILQVRRSLVAGTTLQRVPRFTGPIPIRFNFSQLSYLQRMDQDFFPLFFFSFLFFQPYCTSTRAQVHIIVPKTDKHAVPENTGVIDSVQDSKYTPGEQAQEILKLN